MTTKIIEDGNDIIATAKMGSRIGHYEKALEDTVVVKKAFLQKIADEWNSDRGEVTLADFLLGASPDTWLQKAQDELEEL